MTATAIGAYATTTLLKSLIGTTDSDDDATLGLICDRVNAYIEQLTGRVLAPVSSATFLLDGDGTNRLYFPRGIRAVSLLEIADQTDGTYATETSTNYRLRPPDYERKPGWPATWLVLTNMSTNHRWFPRGYDTVRMTATTGFAAIPDDVTDVALVVAQRAWNARAVGYQDVGGVDEQGRPAVARYLSGRDRDTLRAYSTVLAP